MNVAEILYGIERLPLGRRKRQLRELVGDVFSAFDDKVRAFDHEAARAYASLVDRRSDSEGPSKGLTLRSLQSAPFMAQPGLPDI